MILCGNHCVPCCDFCIHAIHQLYTDGNNPAIVGEPIGCKLHDDEEHELIAVTCGSCKDFHCFRTEGDMLYDRGRIY